MCSFPNPHEFQPDTSLRERTSWASFRASETYPPCFQSQSIFSAAMIVPISAMDAFIARCRRMASSREERLAIFFIDAGNNAEHQPPLRPDAP
ncbi:unannotated protein [freshwater metagenome]|uniref:Unannotated protein n=1 Tax=freshwater metagenome TaxID=449393 RepID=A0A6J7CGJ4_9ZZZZ